MALSKSQSATLFSLPPVLGRGFFADEHGLKAAFTY